MFGKIFRNIKENLNNNFPFLLLKEGGYNMDVPDRNGSRTEKIFGRFGRSARSAAAGLALLAASTAPLPAQGVQAAAENPSATSGMLGELVDGMRGRVLKTEDYKWAWTIGWFEMNPDAGDLYKFVMQNEEWRQGDAPSRRMTGYARFGLCDPQLQLHVDGSCTHATEGIGIETMVLHSKDRPLAGFVNNISSNSPDAKYHTAVQPEDRAWQLGEWGLKGPNIDWMAPGMTGQRGRVYWDLEELVPALGVDRDPFSIYTVESLCYGDRQDAECEAAGKRLYEIVAYHVWPDKRGAMIVGDAEPVLIGRLNYETGELRRVDTDKRYLPFWGKETPGFGTSTNGSWYTKIHLGGRDDGGFERKEFGIDTESQAVTHPDMQYIQGLDNCVK